MTRKRETADAFLAKLREDSAYQDARAQEEAERAKRATLLRRAEQPLLSELALAGYKLTSVWDLVNTAAPYPDALPILLDHLERSYPVPIREGIARALAVRDARFAWPTLVRLFKAEPGKRVKDGIACAIGVIADRDLLPELIELVHDRSQGSSRLLLLRALTRLRDPRARETLLELRTDPELATQIGIILQGMERRKRRQAKIIRAW